MGHFCPPGSRSGSAICIRIRIQQLKLMRIRIRIRIRIRNPGKKYLFYSVRYLFCFFIALILNMCLNFYEQYVCPILSLSNNLGSRMCWRSRPKRRFLDHLSGTTFCIRQNGEESIRSGSATLLFSLPVHERWWYTWRGR